MSKSYDSVAVAGRVLIGVLFFMSGLSKLAAGRCAADLNV